MYLGLDTSIAGVLFVAPDLSLIATSATAFVQLVNDWISLNILRHSRKRDYQVKLCAGRETDLILHKRANGANIVQSGDDSMSSGEDHPYLLAISDRNDNYRIHYRGNRRDSLTHMHRSLTAKKATEME